MATKEKKISLGLKRYEIVGFGQERVWKNLVLLECSQRT